MTKRQLLEWLAKEDWSSYGECKGALLTECLADGTATFAPEIYPRGEVYSDWVGVGITDKGRAFLNDDDITV